MQQLVVVEGKGEEYSDTDRQTEAMCRRKWGRRASVLMPVIARIPWKLAARRGSSLGPPEAPWPGWRLDARLPASRTVR